MGGLIQDIKLIGADLPKLEALREKGRNMHHGECKICKTEAPAILPAFYRKAIADFRNRAVYCNRSPQEGTKS